MRIEIGFGAASFRIYSESYSSVFNIYNTGYEYHSPFHVGVDKPTHGYDNGAEGWHNSNYNKHLNKLIRLRTLK